MIEYQKIFVERDRLFIKKKRHIFYDIMISSESRKFFFSTKQKFAP